MRRSDVRWTFPALFLALSSSVAVLSAPARAAEITDVASSFDDDNPFDFRLRAGYEFVTKSAAIKREHEGDPNQQQVDLFKDLVYSHQQHRLGLRAEIGLYQDLMFSVELPMILSDSRSYSYDQRKGSECIYSGKGANCVNAGNSLTTNSAQTEDASDPDPTHYIVPPGGYDAQNGGATFASGSDLVFRGPHRGGSGGDAFDTINFGLTWGALSQKRDSTKPTWVVALEYQVSIGNIMRFTRNSPPGPDANHGVADGLDHLIARTAVSHRFKYVDPYAAFWFDYPIVRRNDTEFFDLGSAAKNQIPQLSGGTIFGLELIPWEKPESHYKLAIDVNGRISGKFDGRGYSELWEVLASSPALNCDPTWNPSCSPQSMTPDPSDPSGKKTVPWNGSTPYQGRPFTGITTIENYATIGGEFALNVQATKYVRFRANFRYEHDQTHLLTTDDVGKPDLNGNRVSKPNEYNPAFRPIINEIGRRYRVDDIDTYVLGIWGQLMF